MFLWVMYLAPPIASTPADGGYSQGFNPQRLGLAVRLLGPVSLGIDALNPAIIVTADLRLVCMPANSPKINICISLQIVLDV
jgi:hypothetical protein